MEKNKFKVFFEYLHTRGILTYILIAILGGVSAHYYNLPKSVVFCTCIFICCCLTIHVSLLDYLISKEGGAENDKEKK